MTEDAWRDWHALPSSAAFLKTTAELDRTRDPKWSKMVHPVSGLEKMGATARSRALLKKRGYSESGVIENLDPNDKELVFVKNLDA